MVHILKNMRFIEILEPYYTHTVIIRYNASIYLCSSHNQLSILSVENDKNGLHSKCNIKIQAEGKIGNQMRI